MHLNQAHKISHVHFVGLQFNILVLCGFVLMNARNGVVERVC